MEYFANEGVITAPVSLGYMGTTAHITEGFYPEVGVGVCERGYALRIVKIRILVLLGGVYYNQRQTCPKRQDLSTPALKSAPPPPTQSWNLRFLEKHVFKDMAAFASFVVLELYRLVSTKSNKNILLLLLLEGVWHVVHL